MLVWLVMRSGFWALSCGVLASVVACGGASSGDNGAAAGSSGATASAGNGAGGTSALGGSSNGGGLAAGSAGKANLAGAGAGGAGGAGGAAHGGNGSAGTSQGGSGGSAGAALDLTDYGSGACMDFTPCGGDPTGTWKIDKVCSDPPFKGIAALCPATQETYEFTGTITFGADHTVSSASQLTFHDLVPASCVASLGGCGAATGALTKCTPAAAGACQCDAPSTVTPDPTETYTVSGTHLVLNRANQPPTALFFCQKGNQLQMRGKAASIIEYQLSR